MSWEPKARKAFAMQSITENEGSSSGGIASVIYSRFIELGGTCYGVAFDSDSRTFKYSRATNFAEINQFRGSKYVRAEMCDIQNRLSMDLKSGKPVVFVGTPCVVAGLRNLYQSSFNNLFLIDLVCHGTPSGKMLLDHLRENGITNPGRITFRTGTKYHLSVFGEGTETMFSKKSTEDLFLEAFLNSRCLDESCYRCDYASQHRPGDITLGDFWGYSGNYRVIDKNRPISLVLANTQHGLEFLKSLDDRLLIEEADYTDAVLGNSQLVSPPKRTKQAETFHASYRSGKSFSKSSRRSRSLKKKLASFPLLRPLAALIKRIR